MLDKALTDDCAEGSINSGHLLATKAAIGTYEANWDVVEASARSVQEIHKTASQADYWFGFAYYFLGCAAYERNQLDSASEYFGVIEKMRYLVNTRLYHDTLIGQALVAMAEADAERVKKYSTAAYSFAIETKDPLSKQISDWFEVRQAIYSGQTLAEKTPHKLTDDSTRYWLLYSSLTQAEYLVHKGDQGAFSETLDYIEKGLQMARNHHNFRLEIQFLAVKSLALKSSGKHNAALELLEKTLNLAEPFRLVRTFLDRGPLMAELIGFLCAKWPKNVYAKALLESFETQMCAAGSTATPAAHFSIWNEQLAINNILNGLTNRELEVLQLLHERLTDKEIAEKLFISVTTVKSHTTSIYRKLDVNSRTQAVAKGIALGIVES